MARDTVQSDKADFPTGLRGGRFAPLDPGQASPDQKAVIANLLAGPRGARTGLAGPFNALLRSPQLGDRLQKLGEYVRFQSALPARLNELAILMTARHWTSQFEWHAHYIFALEAGLDPAVADAIAKGRRPIALRTDEIAVYEFCAELLSEKQVSDAKFAAVKALFGEAGVVDLIGTVGYYHIVSMILNVDCYPLPDGVPPPLQKLD
jgi:4-carboxymuconolactone decarboxylase